MAASFPGKPPETPRSRPLVQTQPRQDTLSKRPLKRFGQQGGQDAGGGWYEREGQAMQCQVCDTPYMTAPGIGHYFPDLGCESHVGKDERDLEAIDQFEVRRRKRDGKVFAGMLDAALLRLRTLCLADCKRTEAIWRVIKG